jgi:NAD(P)-dependent dehydrogenase (short-subunit alcohol dehydrogenase family)
MGRALGLRWAHVGHDVLFGSRDLNKAKTIAAKGSASTQAGDFDAAAAFGEVILYTIRDHFPSSVLKQPQALSGKIVIDCNNSAILGLDVPDPNNRPGLHFTTPMAECAEEDYDRIFNTNTKGVFFTLKEAARRLNDGGRIIVTSTGGTKMFFPEQSLYLGSKGAVEQFVRALSRELGGRGITVNAISPDPTETDMMQDRYRDRAAAMSPFNRIGDPKESERRRNCLMRLRPATWRFGRGILLKAAFTPTKKAM